MLKIGEFSKLTGVSIHMLRHYDKVGLIHPSYVDETTGYRYYDESQIIKANQIQVLKGLGFGLQEIKEIQKDIHSDDELRTFLEEKIEEKIEERNVINKQIKQIRKVIDELEEDKVTLALEVNVKVLPKRTVVSLRDIIHKFPEEGRLWGRLVEECKEQGVRLAEVPYTFAITHHLDFKHSIIDVEVQYVIDKPYKVTGDIKCFQVPQCQVAAIAFKGEYTQIEEINVYIEKWIKENDYEMAGIPFTTYYRSPGNEQDPNQFVTELCFPIKKCYKVWKSN